MPFPEELRDEMIADGWVSDPTINYPDRLTCMIGPYRFSAIGWVSNNEPVVWVVELNASRFKADGQPEIYCREIGDVRGFILDVTDPPVEVLNQFISYSRPTTFVKANP